MEYEVAVTSTVDAVSRWNSIESGDFRGKGSTPYIVSSKQSTKYMVAPRLAPSAYCILTVVSLGPYEGCSVMLADRAHSSSSILVQVTAFLCLLI